MNIYEQTGNVSKDANYKKGSIGNAVSKKKKNSIRNEEFL